MFRARILPEPREVIHRGSGDGQVAGQVGVQEV